MDQVPRILEKKDLEEADFKVLSRLLREEVRYDLDLLSIWETDGKMPKDFARVRSLVGHVKCDVCAQILGDARVGSKLLKNLNQQAVKRLYGSNPDGGASIPKRLCGEDALAFVVRKVAVMKAMVQLDPDDPGMPSKKLKWDVRLKNIKQALLELEKVLKEV